jgi:hypothetical protein
MKEFKAIPHKPYNNDNTVYVFKAKSFLDARHWIINNLDCSIEWTLLLNK